MLTIIENRSFYSTYLRGQGIEIGALNHPLPFVHQDAKVTYVDYLTTTELRQKFPGLDGIVDVGIVTSGDELAEVEPDSLHFIIANHVIEHLRDPLRGIKIWHSKLKVGGVLFLAFPNIVHCPDKVRPVTAPGHMIDEHLAPAGETADEHLLAFVWAWNPAYFPEPDRIKSLLDRMWESGRLTLEPQELESLGPNRAAVEELLAKRESDIHHHTFTADSMLELFRRIFAQFDFRFRIKDISLGKGLLSEIIFVLEKTDATATEFLDPRAQTALHVEEFIESYVHAHSG